MVFCSNCGATNQSGHYCQHCGATLGNSSGGGSHPPPQQSNVQYARKTCGKCRGNCRDMYGGPCPGCGGVGQVAVRVPTHQCNNCRGTGAGMFGDMTKCDICGGSGWEHSKKLR